MRLKLIDNMYAHLLICHYAGPSHKAGSSQVGPLDRLLCSPFTRHCQALPEGNLMRRAVRILRSELIYRGCATLNYCGQLF